MISNYFKKSLELILSMLTHNGESSLLRSLKDEEYLLDISTGFLENNRNSAVVEVELVVTPKGYINK